MSHDLYIGERMINDQRHIFVAGIFFHFHYIIYLPYCIQFVQASYGTESRFGDSVNSSDFNPYFGTDYGICSLIKPQLAFNRSLNEVPYWPKIFGEHNWHVSRGAEVGKANGLSMLLDAETFDYTFHLKAGEGFKIAVHHHLGNVVQQQQVVLKYLL